MALRTQGTTLPFHPHSSPEYQEVATTASAPWGCWRTSSRAAWGKSYNCSQWQQQKWMVYTCNWILNPANTLLWGQGALVFYFTRWLFQFVSILYKSIPLPFYLSSADDLPQLLRETRGHCLGNSLIFIPIFPIPNLFSVLVKGVPFPLDSYLCS